MQGVRGVFKASSGKEPTATGLVQRHEVDLVINDPEYGDKETVTDGYLIRRTAVDFGVSLITNVKCAVLLSLALERVKTRQSTFGLKSMEEFYQLGANEHHHS